MRKSTLTQAVTQFGSLLLLSLFIRNTTARDLDAILEEGVLRHLGIPYANFVTGYGDGLDVDLIQGFAAHLGVRYEFVETDWPRLISDLTESHARSASQNAGFLATTPIRGDVAASGITILEWRKKVAVFSDPTFPSDIWLIARADSKLTLITPSGQMDDDIQTVKAMLQGVSVLTHPNTCLDSRLLDLESTGADVRFQPSDRKLNEMVPALLNDNAETTLLDVSDALIALDRWSGQAKVIGPVSARQYTAAAFHQNSPQLQRAFNAYLEQIRRNGTYNRIVEKYYPAVFRYFADFFSASSQE